MAQMRFRPSEREREADWGPPKVLAETLRHTKAQEHLLRRLGQAVVLQWEALPSQLQDVLIDQAAIVEDAEAGAHGVSDFETFLRKVKSGPLSRSEKPALG